MDIIRFSLVKRANLSRPCWNDPDTHETGLHPATKKHLAEAADAGAPPRCYWALRWFGGISGDHQPGLKMRFFPLKRCTGYIVVIIPIIVIIYGKNMKKSWDYNILYQQKMYWLVVDLHLWKMMEWKSVGIMTFPTEWKNKIHVPNHQPVYDICLKCKAYRLDRGICLENKGYLFHPVKMASRQNSKFLMHSLVRR